MPSKPFCVVSTSRSMCPPPSGTVLGELDERVGFGMHASSRSNTVAVCYLSGGHRPAEFPLRNRVRGDCCPHGAIGGGVGRLKASRLLMCPVFRKRHAGRLLTDWLQAGRLGFRRRGGRSRAGVRRTAAGALR